MGIIGGAIKGIGKGIGGIARGVRNRKIRKAGGTPTASGTAKTARKAARQEKRAIKRASGGGFLKKAIARRRDRKASGDLKRQKRRARKEEALKSVAPTDNILDVGTGLPDYSEMLQDTGGEGEGAGAQGQGNAVTNWIGKNWIVLAIGVVLIFIGKLLFGNKKK